MGERSSSVTGMPRNPGIDVLRAIGALIVFAFHAGLYVPGWFGIQVFFVISGYLITWSLERDREDTPRRRILAFYGRRLRRIGPALWLYLAAVLPFVLAVKPDLLASWLTCATFSHNFYFEARPHVHSYLFTHIWPLGVVVQFYVFYPLLLVLRPNWTTAVLAMALLVGPALRLAFPGIWGDPLYHVDAFAGGALLRLHGERVRPLMTMAVLIGVVAVLGALEALSPLSAVASTIDRAGGYSLVVLLAVLLIVQFSALRVTGLPLRALAVLGVYVYEFYLLHYPMFRLAEGLVPGGVGQRELVAALACLPALFLAAVALHHGAGWLANRLAGPAQ